MATDPGATALDPGAGSARSEMICPDHERPPVGSCPTCGRDLCGECLDGLESLRAFVCPDCGGRGAVLFDEDLGEGPDEPTP